MTLTGELGTVSTRMRISEPILRAAARTVGTKRPRTHEPCLLGYYYQRWYKLVRKNQPQLCSALGVLSVVLGQASGGGALWESWVLRRET